MNLVLLVDKIVNGLPGDPEENRAQGYLIALQATKKYSQKIRDCTLEMYIVTCVRKGVRNWNREQGTIRVPARSQVRGRKKLGVWHVGTDEGKLGAREGPVNLEEIIKRVTRDEVDVAIVEMRLEGLIDSDIAHNLGVSTSFVQKRRAAMQERL